MGQIINGKEVALKVKEDIKNFINGRTHCSYTTCDCEHIILKTEYL